ncbi:MAG: potassium transporter [Nitratiruptor sp.]|nr:potassium transporter [Nitratiruptor sp.]NPA83736.1 potassium transporter [Campylobacterota bacterium]
MEQLAVILLAIFIASLLNILFKKADLPTAIGYIFTGLVVGELFGLTSESSKVLEHIAEIGIIFLMFTIGLEFSFQELRAMKREVFLYGSLQVLSGSILFALFGHLLFGLETKSAIIVGSALALSSTAIVLKILNENGDIHASYGRKALGILLFQDIAVIPILLMIEIFTKEISISALLLQTLGNMLLFFLLLYFLGKFLIDRYLHYAIVTKNQEIFLLAIFFIVLASAEVAHFFGFSYSLGAFFAGMLLAESHYKYQIEADLAPFRDLLLGVFFFAVGNKIDLSLVTQHIGMILFITISVMLLKAASIYLILSLFEQRRTAFKTALALAQIGEFALAIFVLAQNNGFLDQEEVNILAASVILSMILTPFILKNLRRLADWIFKEPTPELAIDSAGFANHIVVCGYGPLGKVVAHSLKERGFQYIILEHDLTLYEEAQKANEPVFFANAAQRSVLEQLGVKKSCAVVITFHNLEKIRLVAQAVLDLAPHAYLVARVRDSKEQEALRETPIDELIVTTEVLSAAMVEKLFYCRFDRPYQREESLKERKEEIERLKKPEGDS